MVAEARDFGRMVVVRALILRLVAIGVALVALVGETMTAPLLLSTVALSGFSLLVLVSKPVQDIVVRHPLVLILDLAVILLVVAVMGSTSPLVLATFSTAVIIGVLLPRHTSFAMAVILVAGYLLASGVLVEPEQGFMVAFGVPTLYVFLVAIGSAVRAAHAAHADAALALTGAREAAAAADERARLAREIHDSVGKSLHGIALAAQALPGWVERDPAAAAGHALALADGAEHAAGEARQLLVRMRADQPDRPLAEVLAERCARWQDEHGIPCRFTASEVVDICTGDRYEILAVVGEAMENVARHARASSVTVTLRRGEPDGVEVEVRDDGAGFAGAANGRSPHGHFGLTGMHERARSIGADLTVLSAPGQGTTVRLHHRGEE